MAIAVQSNHAGHGGLNMMDVGAVNGSYKEAIIARTINSKVLAIMGGNDATDNKGSTVNQNLYNIVQLMNKWGKWGGWNLSHHLNAFNKIANGVEVWYYLGDEEGRAMATKVSRAIAGALGLVDRGAKPTTNFYVVANSVGSTLLIEWAFIDNAKDIASLTKNMDKAITALVNCFGYAGSTKPPAKPKPPVKPRPPAKPKPPVKPPAKPRATVAKHATHYSPSSGSKKISAHVKGSTYDILETRPIKQSRSDKEHKLGNNGAVIGWVLSQDIVGGSTINTATGYARSYDEKATMYATEANWVKRTPTKSAGVVEWQNVGQGIKYHKVVWNDGIVWLQYNYGGGGQAFVAYADAVGTGFGRKYGYCK